MDQHRVARAVHGMLTPDGASVHVHATTHRGIETEAELPLPSPPYPALDELSRRYLGPPPPRFGGPGRSGESEVYRAAGFRGPTSITVSRPVVTRSIEEVIAAHLSLSSSTPHLFGDRLAGFLDEARALLHAASPTGKFSEQLREVAADIWWSVRTGDYSEARDRAPSDLQRLAGLLSATGPAMELRSPLTGTRSRRAAHLDRGRRTGRRRAGPGRPGRVGRAAGRGAGRRCCSASTTRCWTAGTTSSTWSSPAAARPG